MKWYYTKNAQQFGPVETDELKYLFSTGKLDPEELVWNESMPLWLPASQVPEIATLFTPSISPIPCTAQQFLNYNNPDPHIPVPKNPDAPYYPQDSSLAVASLVLGILSYFVIIPILCVIPLSITSFIALIMGIVALKRTRQKYGAPGRVIAICGIILSSISAAAYFCFYLYLFYFA